MADVAAGQDGAISRKQLRQLRVGRGTVTRWLAAGLLHRVHPGVYAVGHPALSLMGRLRAALLYAGPGAALSHITAAWRRDLVDDEPRTIHLSTPGRRASLPGVRVHSRRRFDQTTSNGLAVTTIPQTLLDIAATNRRLLRRALREADYRRMLDFDAIDAILGRGRPGSTTLRQELKRYRPQYGRTRNEFEAVFLDICEAYDILFPEVNAVVCGYEVDAYWPEQQLIVELDGRGAHGTPARIEEDRRKELVLRRAGTVIQRYSWNQLTNDAPSVAADVIRTLGERLPAAGRRSP